MKKSLAVIMILVAHSLFATTLVWSKKNNFEGWRALRNVQCAIVANNLVLTNIEMDPQLISGVTLIDPTKVNQIEIRYRATGIPNKTQGQVYYKNNFGGFSAERFWKIPSLNNDGKWHTLVLDTSSISNQESWFKGGTVTQLRLDMMDQAGGTIEIEYINLTLVGKEESAQTTLTWSAENGFKNWRALRNVQCKIVKNNLVLTNIEKDSQLINETTIIDPTKFNQIEIKYRAIGIPQRTSGQVYYNNKLGGFGAKRVWKIPSLNSDTKWHTLILDASSISDQDSWFKGGAVTKLRLDMMDQAGGVIEIEYIKLTSDNKKKSELTINFKQELEESPFPEVIPEFNDNPIGLSNEPYFSGYMIKSPDDQPENLPKTFYLRRSFELDFVPAEAYLQYTADDKVTVYINGVELGSNADWRKAKTVIVTKNLKKGNNILAAKYKNIRSAGGFLCELCVKKPSGAFIKINSDEKFKTYSEQQEGWVNIDFDDSKWMDVVLQAAPPHLPWTYKPNYINFTNPQKFLGHSNERIKYNAGETYKTQMHFSGVMPSLPLSIYIDFKDSGNNTILSEKIELDKKAVRQKIKDEWTIDLNYSLPKYLQSQTFYMFVKIPAIMITSGEDPIMKLSYTQNDIPIKRVTSSVKKTVYGPVWQIDGNPFYPSWGLVTGKNPTQRLNDAKLNLRTVFSTGFWSGIDKYDHTKIDCWVERTLRQNPDAKLMIDIRLEVPKEYKKEWSDEISRDECGNEPFSKLYYVSGLIYSFSSKKVIEEMKRAITFLINHCENSPYHDKIIGYRISAGKTSELLGWDFRKNLFLDYSSNNQKEFKKFITEYYPKISNCDQIPSTKMRMRREKGRSFLNPQKDLPVIAYYDFYSHSIAKMGAELGLHAKKVLKNKKVVSAYYGYSCHLPGGAYGRERGHYALKSFMDSKAFDLLCSPQSYGTRKIGNILGDMKPFKTLGNNNIISVIEDDSRTHNLPYLLISGNYQTVNQEQTVNVLRRNMGTQLCRNLPFYLYAVQSGTGFDFPQCSKDMDIIKTVGQFNLDKKVQRNAEIAVVFSEKSLLYVAQELVGERVGLTQSYDKNGKVRVTERGPLRLLGESILWQTVRLAQTGAPVDYLLAEDLKDNLGKYKLWIFLNNYQYDDDFLKVIEKLRNENTTMLWLHAPGYFHDLTGNVENMKKLTGFDFSENETGVFPAVQWENEKIMGVYSRKCTPVFVVGKNEDTKIIANYAGTDLAGLAEMKHGKSRSIFCGAYKLDPWFLIKLAQECGIHLYTKSEDITDANDSLFMLHSRVTGDKKIMLPKKTDVIDVFNRKIIAEKINSFTFNAPIHSTSLFYYGDDAKELLQKLQALE
ncbi:MAG: hypothetical protein PHS31_01280 [Victivallaceae bacterium]|nr:hypothetical protein [Victivallaceae bacterium]MDD4180735.1 hypothetical protein [Victivallaceae bacterium]